MPDKYNVFISFKNSDKDGNRTKDSVLAEKLYHFLKEKGLSVFFSNIELEFTGKSQYSKVIDDAIDSSRFLIAVGCSKENLNSEWVYHEWASFLNEIRSGRKPNSELFTFYDDMRINDLPLSLRELQAFNAQEKDSCERLYNFINNAMKNDGVGYKRNEDDNENKNKTTDIPSTRKIDIIEYADHSKYTGELLNGELDGYGILTYENGIKFTGIFSQNSGIFGVMDYGTQPEVAVMFGIGYWKNGAISGKGVNIFKNGDVYVGDLSENKRSGKGIYIWKIGHIYIGQWLNNNHNGYGRMIYSNGKSDDGIWENNNFKERIKQFTEKIIIGYGRNEDENSIYTGEFSSDKTASVFGYSIDKETGVSNIGFYKNGVINGENLLIAPDIGYGVTIFDDNMNGKGILHNKNGHTYIGELSKGQCTGYGVKIYANGERREGMFKNGEYIGEKSTV